MVECRLYMAKVIGSSPFSPTMKQEMEGDMELKLKTEIGDVTAVFVSSPVNAYKNAYTAWIIEKPGVIVQSDSVGEAIDDLHISLRMMLEVEKKMKDEEEYALLEQEKVKFDYRN